MDDSERVSDRDIARQAAIHSLVSNLVYLAVMVGFTVAITKRDAITRLLMRCRNWQRGRPAEPGPDAMHQLHRDIARFEGRIPE